MTVTWLQFNNAVAKRVGIVQGDAGELATSTVTSTATGLVATGPFTDSSRQRQIDVLLQVSNEAFHMVFDLGLLPKELATATMTLVTSQREYSLPSDFERFAGGDYGTRVIRGATDRWLIHEYPGGYVQMLADQPVATDWVGQPQYFAISPADDKLRLDRDPTSNENGRTYNFAYDKRIGFTSTMATDSVPFSDTVADSLVPVVAEAWSRAFKNEYDASILQVSLSRAVRVARRSQPNDRWGRRRG